MEHTSGHHSAHGDAGHAAAAAHEQGGIGDLAERVDWEQLCHRDGIGHEAREALVAQDVQRAFTLADKAYLLADELAKRPR